jgi:indolepyruvate ferredoxin oxidoreductase beta subunit
VWNILICGVGGQGILLASDILAEVALEAGYDVKKSEVHGMAQRGGSVVSHVRFGEKVYSPLISVGDADAILSFEKLEALRAVHYLSSDGLVVLNNIEILPMPCASGLEEYPTEIVEKLKARAKTVELIDGVKLAKKAGSPRTVNVVLLGGLAKHLELPPEGWLKVIERRVPKKTVAVNRRAFELGYGGAQ